MSDTYSPKPVRPWIPQWMDELRRNACKVCRGQIKVMAFIGTGVCSGRCEKRAARSAVSVCGKHCGEDMPGVTIHCRETCCHGRAS